MRTTFLFGISLLTVLLLTGGCDHGLEPPAKVENGFITGVITYTGAWPPRSEVHDIRFVAMRFVPHDTLDFLQLNRMVISDGLTYGVASESFSVRAVEPGVFVYSGVAQQQSSDLLSWRPVGLLDGDGGIFSVDPGAEVHLELIVDFDHIPLFPPAQ